MTGARVRALLVIASLIVAAISFAIGTGTQRSGSLPPRDPSRRPPLLLLTSLPLQFGEDFTLQQIGSPALHGLQRRYRVIPISVTDPPELAKASLLLMAHPLAQPAEDLVALDDWVKAGGRLLLLADPMLEWPSKLPFGDPLRPPPMFMDTGLLAHWGLRLDAPDERGPKVEKLGGFDVVTVSPGRLYGRCRISSDRLVAHCAIGKGRATIVADADFLDAGRLGSRAARNVDGLLEELDELERS